MEDDDTGSHLPELQTGKWWEEPALLFILFPGSGEAMGGWDTSQHGGESNGIIADWLRLPLIVTHWRMFRNFSWCKAQREGL